METQLEMQPQTGQNAIDQKVQAHMVKGNNNNGMDHNDSSSDGNDDDDDEYDEEAAMSPFEWLTSPCSLKPLILSQVLTPHSYTTGGGSTGTSTHTSTTGGEETDPWNVQTQSVRAKALHVGSGSSALGEFLVEELGFGLVVNVDKDAETVARMERRWNRIQRQRQVKQEQQGGRACNTAAANLGEVHFVPFDFNHKFNTEASSSSSSPPPSTTNTIPRCTDQWKYPDESFDLVLDKSTLDCTLCSDNATASLLVWVYRSLAPGGVYLLISFNGMEMLLPLLANLPGAQWEVTTTTMHRHSGPIVAIENNNNQKNKKKKKTKTKKQSACLPLSLQQQQQPQPQYPIEPTTSKQPSMEDCTADMDTATTTNTALSPPAATPSPPPAVQLDLSLSTTTTTPSTTLIDLKKPLNVLICRKTKHPTPMAPRRADSGIGGANNNNNNYNEHHSPHILQHDLLVQHVHQVTQAWFNQQNPLLTKQREEELFQGFQAAAAVSSASASSSSPSPPSSSSMAIAGAGATRTLTLNGLDGTNSIRTPTMNVAAAYPALTTSSISNNINNSNNNSSNNTINVNANNGDQTPPLLLGLPHAYRVLFTPEEREHLTYDLFLEDWEAFLQMPNYAHLPRDCISCETAVAFLKEMQ